MPNSNDLDKLEKDLFVKVINWRKKDLEKVKKKFLDNNIKFITRSEIYCDYSDKSCPLIKNNNKLYADYGHITNNGANYFSTKTKLIVEKLLNN